MVLNNSCLFYEGMRKKSFNLKQFKGISKSPQGAVEKRKTDTAHMFHEVNKSVQGIMKTLIGNPETKPKMLHWLRSIVNVNHKKE